jgi:hypothetical protein
MCIRRKPGRRYGASMNLNPVITVTEVTVASPASLRAPTEASRLDYGTELSNIQVPSQLEFETLATELALTSTVTVQASDSESGWFNP